MFRSRLIGTAVIAVIAAIAYGYTKFRKPDIDVYLDNSTNGPITVTINGKDMGTIPAHSSKTLENVKAGKYQLVAKNQSGAVVEQGEYSVVESNRGDSHNCNIYNIGGENRYALAIIHYSTSGAIPSTANEIGENQKFFSTKEAECKLDKSIPDTVSVGRGGSVTHKYLCHINDSGKVMCPGY